MIVFVDVKIYDKDWLVIFKEPFEQKETIIKNDKQKLINFYNNHKDSIYISFNMKQYVQYILKSIILNMNVFNINQELKNKKGFEISKLFNNVRLITYDMSIESYDLSKLIAYQGHDITCFCSKYNTDDNLSDEDMNIEIRKMSYRIDEMANIFIKKYENFDTIMSLIKEFNLSYENINKTKSQLSAIILGATKKQYNDEWDIHFIDTLKISKYKNVVEWLYDKNNYNYNKNLNVSIAGVDHKVSWGGIHGAIKKCHRKGAIFHIDAEGFYASIMLRYKLLSRNINDYDKYQNIVNTRLAYKKVKDKRQKTYKTVVNGTFGICKDKNSAAFDPRNANIICINGQLLLIDLIEHLEQGIKSFELLQSNTDGIIVKIDDTDEDFKKLDDICYEYEKRTGLSLKFDNIAEIYQKDVNNYVFRFLDKDENGNWIYERKGSYVKENNELDNDLPILNKAIFEALVNKTDIRTLINNEKDFSKFQRIITLSDNYDNLFYNNKRLNTKTIRVFASKNKTNTGIYKCKGNSINKVEYTPEHCFIDNSNIINKDIPTELDREWYISLAIDRYKSFF